VSFTSDPAGDTTDFSIDSTSWWPGVIVLDIDGDGNVDDNVNFCLSDDNSDGVFDTLEISADDTTYGEGTSNDNIADENNDELLTVQTTVRIGPHYDYVVAAPVGNPAGATPAYDYQVTSKSWYIGTVTLHADENFNFVIWDPDSDGVFENLVFNDNRDNSYSGDQQYDTDNTYPIYLPRGTQYGYRLVWFSRRPAYTDATYGDNDLVIQPVDVASPAFSNPSPAAGVAVGIRTPTIKVNLSDVGSEGVTFGIDPGTIRMYVRAELVSHTYAGGVVSWQGYLHPDGPVSVRVEARDYAENPVTATEWTFTVDTTEPVITIISPTPDYVSASPDIVVKGKVADLTWATVEIQGEETAVVDGAFSRVVSLVVGKNTITITVTDQAGNTAIYEMTVTYAPELARPKPEVFPTEKVIFIAAGGIVAIIVLIAVFVKRP
jgi:hypothetical protein